MAQYLREPDDQSLAAAIYAGAFLLMAASFALLNRHVLITKAQYLNEQLPLERRRRILARAQSGLGLYAIGIPLAFVSAYITLGICAALALFYATPLASGLDL
jgi:hypothetical protein